MVYFNKNTEISHYKFHYCAQNDLTIFVFNAQRTK